MFYTEKEIPLKQEIEELMNYSIPYIEFPDQVEVSNQLSEQEKIDLQEPYQQIDEDDDETPKAVVHKKSAKNSREKTEKKSYKKRLKEKYKKPIRKGDKIQNRKKKNKKK